MPIYEYHCAACGIEFEELTSAANATKVTCQACGSRRVARLLSAFAVASGSKKAAAADPGPCGDCGSFERGRCSLN